MKNQIFVTKKKTQNFLIGANKEKFQIQVIKKKMVKFDETRAVGAIIGAKSVSGGMARESWAISSD